jgi:hypothetical protein
VNSITTASIYSENEKASLEPNKSMTKQLVLTFKHNNELVRTVCTVQNIIHFEYIDLSQGMESPV